jgi:hypothetical protein
MAKICQTPSMVKKITRFKIALLVDGRRNVRNWAALCNVDAFHVYHVLAGYGKSDRIEHLMDEYIERVFSKNRVSIGGDTSTAQA